MTIKEFKKIDFSKLPNVICLHYDNGWFSNIDYKYYIDDPESDRVRKILKENNFIESEEGSSIFFKKENLEEEYQLKIDGCEHRDDISFYANSKVNGKELCKMIFTIPTNLNILKACFPTQYIKGIQEMKAFLQPFLNIFNELTDEEKLLLELWK